MSPEPSLERTVLIYKNQKLSKSNGIALIESHQKQKTELETLTQRIKILEQAQIPSLQTIEQSNDRMNKLENKIDTISNIIQDCIIKVPKEISQKSSRSTSYNLTEQNINNISHISYAEAVTGRKRPNTHIRNVKITGNDTKNIMNQISTDITLNKNQIQHISSAGDNRLVVTFRNANDALSFDNTFNAKYQQKATSVQPKPSRPQFKITGNFESRSNDEIIKCLEEDNDLLGHNNIKITTRYTSTVTAESILIECSLPILNEVIKSEFNPMH